MSDEQWKEVLSIQRERAYAHLDSQPETLLDGDGGPAGKTADIVSARLLSADDRLVADLVIERAEPVIYLPIVPSLRWMVNEADPGPITPGFSRQTYVLQGGHATSEVSLEYVPRELWPDRVDQRHTLTLLFLRYRHRIS